MLKWTWRNDDLNVYKMVTHRWSNVFSDIYVMCVMWGGKSHPMITRFWRCRLDNSINSAHGHQPKGTWQSCGDGTHKLEHGIPRQFSECISTSSEVDAHGEVITTESTKFEGSRLSQCGCASASIYVCMCTSLPIERWSRSEPLMMWHQALYRPKHMCQITSLMMWWCNIMTCDHDVTTYHNVAILCQHYTRSKCGTSMNAPKQKIWKCNPYATPSPTYLGAPSLPEPTTALLAFKHLEY